MIPGRILGNLDCEAEFEATHSERPRPRRALPRSALETASHLATLLRACARPGDRLWTPLPVASERLAEVPGLPRPPLESGPLENAATGAGDPGLGRDRCHGALPSAPAGRRPRLRIRRCTRSCGDCRPPTRRSPPWSTTGPSRSRSRTAWATAPGGSDLRVARGPRRPPGGGRPRRAPGETLGAQGPALGCRALAARLRWHPDQRQRAASASRQDHGAANRTAVRTPWTTPLRALGGAHRGRRPGRDARFLGRPARRISTAPWSAPEAPSSDSSSRHLSEVSAFSPPATVSFSNEPSTASPMPCGAAATAASSASTAGVIFNPGAPSGGMLSGKSTPG